MNELVNRVSETNPGWLRLHEIVEMAVEQATGCVRATLDRNQVGCVLLPHHIHSEQDIVPPGGASVMEVVNQRKWQTTDCCRHAKHCSFKSPIILTDFVLNDVLPTDGYDGMSLTPGQLLHLDGLHRMLHWYATATHDDILNVFICFKNIDKCVI
jgi:hypothetical protein